jgi:hypothetical protein
MLRLASDADVDGRIIRGLRRFQPDLDLKRAQDALPEGTPDPDVLAWAGAEQRVLITHDRSTMVGHARKRSAAREPLPGVVVTTDAQTVGEAIEDILIIAHCMAENEIKDEIIIFLPL